MNITVTTADPGSPATHLLLEELVPRLRRMGIPVEPERRKVDRPGTLALDAVVALGLFVAGIQAVAGVIEVVYAELERRREKRREQNPPAPPPQPVRIKVRLPGLGERVVESAAAAREADVEVTGLPADRTVEVVIERE